MHGLPNAARARKHTHPLGIYRKVTVERRSDKRLPYVDKPFNFIVPEQPLEFPMEEVQRVLVPEGVTSVEKEDRWTKTVKLRAETIDEWTHYLQDASGNAGQATLAGYQV